MGTAAVRISGPKQAYTSDCFDHVFDETASNDAVYEQHNGCVRAVLDGFNYTLLAYGQTGSGKTYSMLGPPDLALAAAGAPCAGSPHGVMPRAIHDLFSELEARNRGGQCADGSSGSGSGNVHGWQDVFAIIDAGGRNRATRATDFNAHSSRSHTVLQLWLEQRGPSDGDGGRAGGDGRAGAGSPMVGISASGGAGGGAAGQTAGRSDRQQGPAASLLRSKLTFVDLAGSERWGSRHTGAVGAAGKGLISELTGINTSLSALALVVSALTSGAPAKHIPYRQRDTGGQHSGQSSPSLLDPNALRAGIPS
ncbi:hypothetical protein MNEG_0900 [Monoraphidium neglectum]|uniref:Kinesin-like protein n=1 Tax=Monoraphidium neglectum TaxID=145388 RepID=A0A0D2MX07_9CHLO|nr:hypothetical protein MNEG_0900 [Monoraphidium neglectum]KIZ07050.1 hypothetical protein MNEG_0900 [Monoraphidium neglectum]|eukprot:XP_013906069.1 hypothetical protein MNEG_0900 [Monoraphidium neglectum]